MVLDHVMILNMEHNMERYWTIVGGLDMLGFPALSDMIIRHINHNGLHYKDTKSVHEAAIADGFGEFESFRSRNRQNAAWVWSYRCALKKIVEMDKTVLVLIDDVVPTHNWTFDQFNMLLAEIEGRPLKIIQFPHRHLWRPEKIPQGPKVTSMLRKGLLNGSDIATVLNAEGAALVLRLYAEGHPNVIYYELAFNLHLIGVTDGLYHTHVPSSRFLFDGDFRSQLDLTGFRSQLDLTENEPWEIE